MPAAIGASDFGAHAVGIQAFMNRAGNFIIKTWPAASGSKFAFGIIKRGIALPANIHARLFIVHILASERQLVPLSRITLFSLV